jgi:hypothetical protein
LTFAPALPQSTPSSPLPAPHNILARISFACADPLPGRCKLDHNSTLGSRKKEEPRRSSFFQLLSTISVLLELHQFTYMKWFGVRAFGCQSHRAARGAVPKIAQVNLTNRSL